MVDEKKSSPDKDKEQEAPEGGDSDKGKEKDSDAPSHKFKSWKEAEKAHAELEGKLHITSDEVGEARKLKKQYETWGEMLSQNSELYNKNKEALEAYLKGESYEPGKTKKKAESATAEDPRLTDLRQAQVDDVLKSHYDVYGYNALKGEERKKALSKLATNLADLLDPSGSMPLNKIMHGVSVARLPKYLEKAQTLVDAEKSRERGKLSGILIAEENRAASIGSMAASSLKGEGGVPLSNAEKEVARKQGISVADYKKSKKKILKEQEKYTA